MTSRFYFSFHFLSSLQTPSNWLTEKADILYTASGYMPLMWSLSACGVSILCVLSDSAASTGDLPQSVCVCVCTCVWRWQQRFHGKWRVNHLKNITCCGKYPELISRAIKTCQLELAGNYICVLQLVLIRGRSSHYLMVNNGSAGGTALVVMTSVVRRVNEPK